MQVLKKISCFFVICCLCSCSSSRVQENKGFNDGFTEVSEEEVVRGDSFRVGVLLPLSGEFAKQGQGLKNATMMALDDINNNNLILQYYDTKGTPEGARIAVENALNQDARLIIGPMLSSSVEAIAPIATRKNVPVIAFNSVSDVLQNGVYTLGLLVDEQVDRVMTYAVSRGRSRFALLVPDNKTGIAVARAAVKAAGKNNVAVTDIAFYKPGNIDFSEILKQMTNYAARSAHLNQLKNEYAAKAADGDVHATKMLRKLKTNDSYGNVDFDAVLIPDYGATLKSAVSMFGYYDVFSPEVKFLGTSIWDNTALNKETTMRGSWYPSMSRQNSSYFVSKYYNLFGERPSSLYSYGYDAVALAVALSRNNGRDLNSAIVDPGGYIGINGAFRFFENGFNEHSLEIKEVRDSGNYIVDPAPRRFADTGFAGGEYEETFIKVRPRIYGKNAEVAETLIFGHTLDDEISETESFEVEDY